jgi:hypothetical protein
VVFSGQLVSTLLSLAVVPAVYRTVKGWELGWGADRQHRQEA